MSRSILCSHVSTKRPVSMKARMPLSSRIGQGNATGTEVIACPVNHPSHCRDPGHDRRGNAGILQGERGKSKREPAICGALAALHVLLARTAELLNGIAVS